MIKRLALLFLLASFAATPAHAAPLPAAEVEKSALAGKVAGALWPDGTYARMVDSMIGGKDGLADMVLDMRPAELMGMMLQGMAGPDSKPADAPPPEKERAKTLREELIAKDPHFEERMRITMKVVGEEVARIAKPIEPKLRDGLTKSIARRFTREQLVPIAAFFDSEAGRAYAAQSMSLYIDKDVMLAMMQSVPAVIREMPKAMERVKSATAHLPEPPKPKTDDPPADEEDEEHHDHEEPQADALPST